MKRKIALAIAFVLVVLGYVAVLHRSSERDLPGERKLGFDANEAKMHAYVEPIVINAASDSMQVRVSVSLAGAVEEDQPAVSDHDYSILIGHDDSIERIDVPCLSG